MKRRFLCYGLILSLTAGAVGVPAQAFEITISDSYSISEEDAVQAAEDVAVQEVTDTSEEEAYQWYQVDVYSDGKTNEEILLMMDGVWYMSVTQIEYYTDYRLGKDNTFREYEEYATGGIAKAIEINQDACTAVVRGGYAQQLDHIYEYENELYFPVHQILPLMECACEVKENVLHIENAEVSLADALHDMNPEAIYFDAAAEFDGKAWANSLMVGSAYLFDSIGGDKFRLDRLIGLGNYEDYKTAATDYLTDYEVYQEVMDQRNSTVNLAAGVDQSEDAIDLIFDGYGFMELVHDMLENAGNESVFYEWIPEDIYGDITSWGSAADVSRTALEAAVNYTLMVRDHRDMLAAVYPDITGSVSDLKLKGIKEVYDTYGGSALHAIWDETVEELIKEGLWTMTGKTVALYQAVANFGGNIMDSYASLLGVKDSEAMALLNHHIILTNEAKDVYKDLQSKGYTQENVNRTRLSAMMMLLSSKKCFEIIRDNNSYDSEVKSYCNTRIAAIEEKLALLYLAQDAVLVDGIEYFQDGRDAMEVQLGKLSGIESDPPKPLSELVQFFRENYSKQDTSWLLDIAGDDGIDELLVVTAPDENGITYFRIYTTYDEEISMIYEEFAGTTPGERKAMYLLDDGYGNYAFLYYYPRLLQGYNTEISVFALQTYGGQILLRHETVTLETKLQDTLNDVVAQFGQLNPHWQMLFNNLIGSEQEELQTAFDGTTITFGLSDSSKMDSMSAREKLEQYLMEFYAENDSRWFADLTGDGQEELLVTTWMSDVLYFYVYTVKDNTVSVLYESAAAETHAGQQAMYLVDDGCGNYALFNYMPSTWQDFRSIYAQWFTLNESGEMIVKDSVYTDTNMQEDINTFIWTMYPYSLNMQTIYDTLPEDEKAELTAALAAIRNEGELMGTPDEDSEWSGVPMEEEEPIGTIDEGSSSSYQMPTDIFWTLSDPFDSYQIRFRNESDGCYMDLSNPSSGSVYSTKCTLDFGTSIDIGINDDSLLAQYVISMSPDFTGGGYSMIFNPETKQIYVVTNNGEWIELYFFDN